MKRRHLWVLTTASCAVLALPTVARLISTVLAGAVGPWAASAAASLRRAALAAGDHIPVLANDAWRTTAAVAGDAAGRMATAGAAIDWRVALPAALGVSIACAALGVIATRWSLHRRTPRAAHLRRLARRGRAVSAIARRSGLSQDAVRHLLRTDPPTNQESFADVLADSLNSSIVPAAAYGRDR